MRQDLWDGRVEVADVPAGTRIVLGFDGSDLDDWTVLRAETLDGYQWTPTYGPASLPTVWDPADWNGQTPRLEVDAAVDELMSRFEVVRFYGDPPYWESEMDAWAAKYGEKRVVRWYTNRVVQMHAACERLRTDVAKVGSTFHHDGCEQTSIHVRNARMAARPGGRYILRKPGPSQKIDAAVTSVIAHEAAGDAVKAGLARPKKSSKMLILR